LTEWIAYLKEIGVRELHVPRSSIAWQGRSDPIPVPVDEDRHAVRDEIAAAARQTSLLSEANPFDDPPPADPAARLVEVRKEIGDCTRCKLHEGRTNIVFGVGDPRTRLMFVGEGPGEQEDLQGEPFVGRAGKKLDEMIQAIGLARDRVYIANIVKCRPPKNRDPEPDEIASCSPFLEAQIDAIRPRVIVTLGAPATRTLLGTRVGITKLRGNWQQFRGIPVMPTFHPAYVLRNYTRETRQKVWDDLKAAKVRADG
jgi:DNA polymerase